MNVNAMETEDALSSLPYAHWGGLPATTAALDGFEEARTKDERISSIFSRLDLLDSAPRTVTDLCAAMAACNFTKEEQDLINSPCLDGLMSTCSSPFGQIKEMDPRIQVGDFVLRLLYPKVFLDTLRWLLAGSAKDAAIWANLDLLLIAASGANHVSVVVELLQRPFFTSIPAIKDKMLEYATSHGCHNGNAAAVQLLLNVIRDVRLNREHFLAIALSGGHLALAQLYVDFAQTERFGIQWGHMIPNAVRSGRVSMIDFCVKTAGSSLPHYCLPDAVGPAISTKRLAIVSRLFEIDPRLTVTPDHLYRPIRAKSEQMLMYDTTQAPIPIRNGFPIRPPGTASRPVRSRCQSACHCCCRYSD